MKRTGVDSHRLFCRQEPPHSSKPKLSNVLPQNSSFTPLCIVFRRWQCFTASRMCTEASFQHGDASRRLVHKCSSILADSYRWWGFGIAALFNFTVFTSKLLYWPKDRRLPMCRTPKSGSPERSEAGDLYSYNHFLTSSILNLRPSLLWYQCLTIRENFRSRRHNLRSEDTCRLMRLSKEMHIEETLHPNVRE